MTSWQLQDAKARLSELVKSVADEGPQQITVHGHPAAVVLSPEEYARLIAQKPAFVDFIRQSPLVGLQLPVRRSREMTRRIRL